jgi:predicted ATP-grasp superfamily ATP-dependent carboligase
MIADRTSDVELPPLGRNNLAGAPHDVDCLQPTAASRNMAAVYQPRVLVLGIVPSLTWSVTRCLARAGMRPVVLGWHRVSPLALLPECTYVPMRDVCWKHDELDPALLDQVEQTCRVHAVDQIVPVDFPSVLLLARYGRALQSARVSAVPDPDTMLALHNKWHFSRAIGRMGLPQPRTELARHASDLEATHLTFPIITKPIDRWASVGFQIHHSPRALRQCIESGALQAEFPLLVQEFIPGKDVGFAFLARHGQLVAHAAFEQPRRGVRRYFDAPELQKHAAILLAATAYHGVGEIDARYDPSTGEYRLLEINPRFWASLLYAEHAGMNFPELLVRLDDLAAGPGFAASMRAVSLSPYELAVARSVLLAEQAAHVVQRWRAGALAWRP